MAIEEALEEAVRAWAKKRNRWLQEAVAKLLHGNTISATDIETLADIAVQEAAGKPFVRFDAVQSEPDRTSLDTEAVTIRSITDLDAVNAINWTGGITFEAAGLTIIYGENGSGKSGYARVIKAITRSRHDTPVLSNVFQEHRQPHAKVTVTEGGRDVEFDWPDNIPAVMRRVSFYDSECGQWYVSTESDIAYRPPAIRIFDSLATIAHRVRSELEKRQHEVRTNLVALPAIGRITKGAQILDELSANTAPDELQDAIGDLSQSDQDLEAIDRELRRIDPVSRQDQESRHPRTKSALKLVRDRLSEARKLLSSDNVARLEMMRTEASNALAASDAARAMAFGDEVIAGIGSDSWKVLWEAARKFSNGFAYPSREFPVTMDQEQPAFCVLCNQPLEPPAAERLNRFEAFVAAEAEKAALDSSKRYQDTIAELDSIDLSSPELTLSIDRIEEYEAGVVSAIRAELGSLSDGLRMLVGSEVPAPQQYSPLGDSLALILISQLMERLDQEMEALKSDDLDERVGQLRQQKAELEDRVLLSTHKANILKRIEQLRELNCLETAIKFTDTQTITRQATKLTREHVGEHIASVFREELIAFGLERLILKDIGGQRGSLKLRPELSDSAQDAPLPSILSEGERTALGLAAFLTEVMTDDSCSAVVFDDPVTSLDHVRRERVARRMLELSSSRQVVVFTHDVGFVVDLKRAANGLDVSINERWVNKEGALVGRINMGGPWDARITPQRRQNLEERLAKIRKSGISDSPESYSSEIRNWYQDLRLTWERAVEEVVAGPVVARGKLEIQPRGLQTIARFTDQDNEIFQAAFTRCGDRGSHDRSPELNRPVPPVEELEEDLETLRVWYDRVRKYGQS